MSLFKRLKKSDGQMAIMMSIMFPLMMLLLVFFINIGLLIHQRIRIQTAVDVGSYAAAASMARDLDSIARLNANIKHLFDKDVVGSDWEYEWPNDSEESLMNGSENKTFNEQINVRTFVGTYQGLYNDIIGDINDINQNAMQKAINLGRKSAFYTYYNYWGVQEDSELYEQNPLEFSFQSLHENAKGNLITYSVHTFTTSFTYWKVDESGGDFTDPHAGYGSLDMNVNLPIAKTSPVAFAAKAEAKSGFTNFFPNFFRLENADYQDNQIKLKAYAASQPYGGSVQNFLSTYRATLIRIGGYVNQEEGEFWH